MRHQEKLLLVKAMSGVTDDDTASAYLALAGSKICRKAYPFEPAVTGVPERYDMTQVELAVYMLSRRESVGQLSHSENGYSDSYESGYIPDELLRDVIPVAGVL